MTRLTRIALVIGLAVGVALSGCSSRGDSSRTEGDNEDQKKPAPSKPAAAEDVAWVAPGTQAAIERGVARLRKAQLADGGWPQAGGSQESSLASTVVATHGLLSAGVPADDPMIGKAVDHILGFVKDDGGIYHVGLRNYTTAIGVMALTAAGAEKHKATIDKAVAFLKRLQWDRGEGLGPESADFGGAGYGEHERPDLSNTHMFIQALREAGVDPNDPSVQKALIFVSRTQGTEQAKGYWIALPDGGFIYTPHGGGESKAGQVVLPSGKKGLKAYGSMTYAGFLSLVYAGLKSDDFRVKAALEWIQNNWTVEENPQLGNQGYYYYAMTMGKALRAYGAKEIVDSQGRVHPWRKELSAKLVSLQSADGSWVNAAEERWFEGNPSIATPFALLALSACRAEL